MIVYDLKFQLQSKLIKQYSRQLVAKRNCPDVAKLASFPKLSQWLKVVGLSTKAIDNVTSRINTFEEQFDLDEGRIKEILKEVNASDEEVRRMITALRNLKTFTDRSIHGKSTKDVYLHWDSWDRTVNGAAVKNGSGNSPRVHRNRPSKASENESLKSSPISPPQSSSSNCPFSPSFATEDARDSSFTVEPYRTREKSCSPPPTPSAKKISSGRPPTTPPPARKHQTLLTDFPLTKSKSHEEHLSNRVQAINSTRLVTFSRWNLIFI